MVVYDDSDVLRQGLKKQTPLHQGIQGFGFRARV